MPVATVVAVTEHVAGSEFVDSPRADALEEESGSVVLLESGSRLLLEASGIDELDIVDPDEYDQDGGYITLVDSSGNSETVAFTFSEDTLILSSALSGTYAQGDRVYMTDSLGNRIVERWADVQEPQGEEVLRCRVPHSLYALLPEGVRPNDDTAEQVEFSEDGTDLLVTDVLGKSPIRDLNSELITTSPDGADPQTWMDGDGLHMSMTSSTGALAESLDWFNSSVSSDNPLAFIKPFFSLSGRNQIQHFVSDNSLTSLSGVRFRAPTAASPASSYDVFVFTGTQNLKLLDGAGASDFELATSAGWRDWTPTLSGWSSNPTNTVYRYKQVGKTVMVCIRQASNGTSNATTKSITAPVTAATISNMIWAEQCAATDNGVSLTTSSGISIASGSSTINFSKDLSANTGGWTASGGHKIQTATLIYEAA